MRTNIFKPIFFFVILLLCACTSESGIPKVTKVSFPLVTVDSTSDVLIINGVLNGKFHVDMFYKDYPVDSRIVVAMNGNYASTKIFVASLKTFPSAQNITGAQLMQLFGLTAIAPGDYFEIGLDVQMQDGVWYPAFNPMGIAYGAGPMNLPGASPIITFKAPLPIDTFVGNYTADEPAEAYSYGVSFKRVSTTAVSTANYWNSGWTAVFTIDFVNKTYSMPNTTWDSGYSGIESGTVDLVTGKMVGNYIIYHNGTSIEEGVHTYTKK
jgi:hypothetical protein